MGGKPRPIPEERRISDGVACFVTGNKGKTSVSDKLHVSSDHVFIRQKPQQLAGKATVPDSVISSCQIDIAIALLVGLERILNVLGQ